MPRRLNRIPTNNLRSLEQSLRPAAVRNKKLAARLITEIAKRKVRITNDFYAIGLALQKLSAPALYEAACYSSFKQLLKARKLMSATTAYKLIAIVDAYPNRQAAELGLEKAYALTRFVAATPEEDLPSALARDNPVIGRTRLSDMSVRQLEAATERVRRASPRRPDDPEAKAARKAARLLQRNLRAAGAPSVKVRAMRKDGQWWLRTDMKVEDAEAWG